MKPFHSLLALLFSFFFLLGFTVQTIAPQFKKFVIINIEELSGEHLPIRFLANDIHVSIFPLSISLLDIKTMVNPREIPDLERLTLGKVTVQIDILSMLAGQLTFGDIIVEELDAIYAISSEKSQNRPIDGPDQNSDSDEPVDFRVIQDLPIQNLKLNNSSLKVLADNAQLAAKNLDILVVNEFVALDLQVQTDHLTIEAEGKKFDKVGIFVDSLIDAKAFQLEKLELRWSESHLMLSGNLNHQDFSFESIGGTAQSNVHVSANDIKKVLADEIDFPLEGQADLEASVRFGKSSIFSFDTDLSVTGLNVDDINLGNIRVAGEYSGNQFKFREFYLKTKGGDAAFENAAIDLTTGILNSKFRVKEIDLPVFLNSIDVKDVPVELMIGGLIDCQGTILATPSLTCRGELNVDDFEVRPKPETEDLIVKLDSGKVKGWFEVGQEGVRYDAHLLVGETDIQSNGDIKYDEGFKIFYQTERLDFSALKSIAQIPVEGFAKVQGETSGDSEDATFAMKVTTENFHLSDYLLGDLTTDFSFGARTLYFDNIIGVINNSRYRGDVVVDLDNERIKSDMNFPFFDTPSLVRAVERHLPIPFTITGSGTAHLNFEGPLEFSRLSYHLKANVFRGTIAGDSYDRIALTLNSKNGHVSVETGELTKNETFVSFAGTMTPEFYVDAKFESSQLLLEESETITGITENVTGNMAFTAELTGSIYQPTINFKGRLNKVLFSDQPVPDSTFGFRLSDETFSGTANILGNRVKGQFTFPLTDEAPFRLIGETNNWDFAALLSLFGGDRFKGEYKTTMTSKVDLVATEGGVWNATGSAELNQFLMSRGNQSLTIDKPMTMRFSQGKISIKDFHMQGGDNLIRVEGDGFSRDDLGLNINGRIDLRLLHIFLPFLEEIGGPTSFAFKVAGPLEKPQVLGSAFIEKAYTKIFGVPHLFENIRSDVTFSQSRILINSILADFAKGKLEGSGHVDLQAYGKVPVEISAIGTGLELEIPADVVTKGRADMKFAGDWFPYTLSGLYTVNDGTITMEFQPTTEEASGLQKSTLLPEALIESDFEPILLDIDVDLPPKLRIVNSIVDGYLTGKLKVKKTPDNPILIGTIDVDPESVLRVRENEFDVKSARAEFNNESQIDPILLVSAETQKDSNDTSYTIDLLMQGTASDPIYKFTSQPPLDEINIISLLALGITTDSGTQDDAKFQREAFEQASNLLPFRQDLEEQLGVKVTFSTEDAGATDTAKVKISKDFDNRLSGSISRTLGKSNDSAEIRYRFTDKLSGVGRYRTNDLTEDQQSTETEDSIIGVDLEYKVEFR